MFEKHKKNGENINLKKVGISNLYEFLFKYTVKKYFFFFNEVFIEH